MLQFEQIERLFHEVLGAIFHRFHRDRHLAVSGVMITCGRMGEAGGLGEQVGSTSRQAGARRG